MSVQFLDVVRGKPDFDTNKANFVNKAEKEKTKLARNDVGRCVGELASTRVRRVFGLMHVLFYLLEWRFRKCRLPRGKIGFAPIDLLIAIKGNQ